MTDRGKRFQSILLIILTILFIKALQGETTCRLYGDIAIRSVSRDINENTLIIPLRDFLVEIIEIITDSNNKEKAGKVLFTTYPDFYGIYAFKDVPENTYYLRISYNPPGQRDAQNGEIYKEKINIKYNKKGRMRLDTLEVLVRAEDKKDNDDIDKKAKEELVPNS